MGEVLLVTKPVGPPWDDGTLVMVRELVSHLARWSPRILGRKGDPWAPPRGVVERIHGPRRGLPGTGQIAQARTLRRLLVPGDEAVRHFVFAPSPPTARAATLSRRARRVPIVQTVPSRPARFESALAFGDLLVVPSGWSERRWADEAGVSSLRIRRVPPAVPAPGEPPSAEKRRARRRSAGVDGERPVLLYPGDLELGGHAAATTVDAFARLDRRTADDPVLLMACRPKTRAAASAQRELTRRARALGVGDRVRWLGRVPDFVGLLASVDLVVLPATDTFGKVDLPLALLEAMAAGTPAVVPDQGPLAELAEDGSAVAVAAESPDALASALGTLLDDPEARRRVARAGVRRVTTFHDPERIAARYEALYDEVAG